MLKRHFEQRHIDLDSGRSCLAVAREYWKALEGRAYEEGQARGQELPAL